MEDFIEVANVEIECPLCGKVHYVTIATDDFGKWQGGMNAQDAFPYLSTTEREELISGICPECQEKIFD